MPEMIYSDGTSINIRYGHQTHNTKKFPMSKQVIAFNVGKLDDNQINILVVFADWNIALYDPNLVQIWKTQKSDNPTTPPQNVGISIIPYRVHTTDKGMVIVGMKSNSVKSTYSYFAFDGKTGQVRWKHDSENTPQDDKIKSKTNLKERGEVNWRHYKSDILNLLPHCFKNSHDISFSIHHFVPETEKVSRIVAIEANKLETKKTFPNVLVAHAHDGIEVIHLYTGRQITRLAPLHQDVLYADTNGNGIVDSVRTTNAPGNPEHCTARIDSGIPNTQDLIFSTSICSTTDTFNKFKSLQEDSTTSIKFAPPVGSGTYLYFLASNGVVTGVNDEKLLFQTATSSKSKQNVENRFALQLILLDRKDHFFVLAFGEEVLNVLDQNGNIVSTTKLDVPIMDTVHLYDVNEDGILDLIVVQEGNFAVYVTKTHRGLSVLSFLTISLVVVVLLMYISTFINLRDPFFEKNQQFSK